MARPRTRHALRDPSEIASGLLSDPSEDIYRPLAGLFPTQSAVRSLLSEVEDRRYWHPQRTLLMDAPVRSLRRAYVPLRLASLPRRPGQPGRRRFGRNWSVMAFKAPRHVAICVRRRSRREVLFAVRRAGRGRAVRRYRRFNSYSSVRC